MKLISMNRLLILLLSLKNQIKNKLLIKKLHKKKLINEFYFKKLFLFILLLIVQKKFILIFLNNFNLLFLFFNFKFTNKMILL